MPIAGISIIIGILTIIVICGGLWLYFRLGLSNLYQRRDPRAGAGHRRRIYETTKTSVASQGRKRR